MLVITWGLGLLFQADASLKSLQCAVAREWSGFVWRWDSNMFLTYFQPSECVCVCLQPNREQISEEPLNGTYKLIAKWLKSLGCYLSVSLEEALCHSSMRPVSLLITWFLWQFRFSLPYLKEKPEWYIGSITCHSDVYATSARWTAY